MGQPKTALCRGCRQPIDVDWLVDGRCHGCRREFQELKKWHTNITCDRDQYKRRGSQSEAQYRLFGTRTGWDKQHSD